MYSSKVQAICKAWVDYLSDIARAGAAMDGHNEVLARSGDVADADAFIQRAKQHLQDAEARAHLVSLVGERDHARSMIRVAKAMSSCCDMLVDLGLRQNLESALGEILKINSSLARLRQRLSKAVGVQLPALIPFGKAS